MKKQLSLWAIMGLIPAIAQVTSPNPAYNPQSSVGSDGVTLTWAPQGLNNPNDIYRIYYRQTGASSSSPVVIGDQYEGGIIAYIYQPGDSGFVQGEINGLIVPPTDQGLHEWGCFGTFLNVTDGALNTGQSNTSAIITACPSASAALVCENLTVGGYSDWYLPSRDELQKISANSNIIGGFRQEPYWSSTEENGNRAYLVQFINGPNQGNAFGRIKNDGTKPVRAVRSFRIAPSSPSGVWLSSPRSGTSATLALCPGSYEYFITHLNPQKRIDSSDLGSFAISCSDLDFTYQDSSFTSNRINSVWNYRNITFFNFTNDSKYAPLTFIYSGNYTLLGINPRTYGSSRTLTLQKRGNISADYYSIQVTNRCNCASSKVLSGSFKNDPNEGSHEFSIDRSIYPNPSNGQIFFADYKGAQVSMSDINGRIMVRTYIDSELFEIDGSAFSPGVYIIQIQLADQLESRRIIIE